MVMLLKVNKNFFLTIPTVIYIFMNVSCFELEEGPDTKGVARAGPGTGNIWTTDGHRVNT